MSPQPTYNFLADYITQVIEQSGVGKLTEENKKKFLPQLVARAEHQIGLVLLPKLSDADAETFAQMMDIGDVSAKKWEEFWRQAVPDFESVVQQTMINFGKQCQELLAK